MALGAIFFVKEDQLTNMYCWLLYTCKIYLSYLLMAPILSDHNGNDINILIDTAENADKVFAGITDAEAEIIKNFLELRKYRKEEAVRKAKADYIYIENSPKNPAMPQRRLDIIEWYKQKHPQLNKVCEETMEFLKGCEETDDYIKVWKLKLRKKALAVDVKHELNDPTIFGVFEEKKDNYSGGYDILTKVRQDVLNDISHPMHYVVEEAIQKMKEDGFSPATQADFDYLLAVLPGTNKEEKLVALQMLTGWIGCWVLDPVKNALPPREKDHRAFVFLGRHDYSNKILADGINGDNGSIWWVQECE